MVIHGDPGNGLPDRIPPTGRLPATTIPMTSVVSRTDRHTGLAIVWRLALVVLVVLTGCSGDSGDADEPVATVVPCSNAIDAVDDIGPSYVTHGSNGGFVALPSEGWLSSGDLQLGRMGSPGSVFEGFRFSKFGLLVRRDRLVSLKVVGSLDEAFLDYVHPDTPARAVSVGPCSSGEWEWAVFAGGVWVAEPGCVEVLALSGEESIRVRLPVGAPCDAEW